MIRPTTNPPFLRTHAIDRLRGMLRMRVAHYRRERDLALLVPELADPFAGTARPPSRPAIIAALEAALARERRRGASGHRSYCLARHMGLAAALAAETATPGRHAPPPDRPQ